MFVCEIYQLSVKIVDILVLGGISWNSIFFRSFVTKITDMEDLHRLYPIGIQTFSEIREENYLYIDKTDRKSVV